MIKFFNKHKKKILISITSILLCVCLLFSSVFSVSAAIDTSGDIDYSKYTYAAFIVGANNRKFGFYDFSYYNDLGRNSMPTADDGMNSFQNLQTGYPYGASKSDYYPLGYLGTRTNSDGSKTYGGFLHFSPTFDGYHKRGLDDLIIHQSNYTLLGGSDFSIRLNFYLPNIGNNSQWLYKSSPKIKLAINDGSYVECESYVQRIYQCSYTTPTPWDGAYDSTRYCTFVSIVADGYAEESLKVTGIFLEWDGTQQVSEGILVDRPMLFMYCESSYKIKALGNAIVDGFEEVFTEQVTIVSGLSRFFVNVTEFLVTGINNAVNIVAKLGGLLGGE